ncbi:MAG: 2-methoxy-6-polyprenyl-1,4-benzoquinol methylase, mitochondrial [Chlamydiales bacterium]|nr:2-methoxy-6-polyprenyl-1,4-benzoquinol methylase, mitochondrial [Chlamydiales bacterium]
MKQYDDVWKNSRVDLHFKADIPQKLLELFEQENVQTVLDLGSGDGTIAVALAKQGKTVHALEISNEGIEKTKAQAQEAQISVHVLEQDMYQALPFKDRSLDVVIAFQSLNHNILPKIEKLFAEITRILKHGGLFIVKTANFNSFDLKNLGDGFYEDSHGGISCTLRFIDKQTYVPQDGPEKGLIHYAFLPEQLTEKIEALGYTQIYAEILQWHILAMFKKNYTNCN